MVVEDQRPFLLGFQLLLLLLLTLLLALQVDLVMVRKEREMVRHDRDLPNPTPVPLNCVSRYTSSNGYRLSIYYMQARHYGDIYSLFCRWEN